MPLAYRTTPLPAVWPGIQTAEPQRSRFKASMGPTMVLLERELGYLNAREVELAIAVHAHQIRQDGGVFASARIQNAAVILSFISDSDRLSFPCDTFDWWEDNVRAIALALQALRAVDRYGVQQGKQYEGFKALGSGVERPPEITPDIHALNIARMTDGEVDAAKILRNPEVAKRAIRLARGRTHPDAGGSPAEWAMVQTAAAGLSKHHGLPL